MKRLANTLFYILAFFTSSVSVEAETGYCPVSNNCISFSVASGTGCDWMCSYCANTLGTNNYYFTDGVCKYASGGCVGNPQAGVQYTCCSA